MQSSSGQSLDTSSDGTRAAGLPSPNVVRTNNRESERWYDYHDGGTPVKAHDGGQARSSAEWYRHDGGQPSNESTATSGHRTGRNDDAKRLALAAGSDPNDWYRHDHQSNGTVDSTRSGKRVSAGKSVANGDESPLWFASDGVWHDKKANDGETMGKPSTFSPKNRHSDAEASAYYQRDKTGSSSEWYPHEHESGEPQHAVRGRRSGAEAEGIARRLKTESEDWYVYDGPGESRPSPVVRPARAVSPEVRRMQELGTGDEMKQTLRMDDNLRASNSVSSNSEST